MLSYAVTLSDALTPITLISGVGLLLLAMTARYNYTTDRVRALLKERRQKAPVIDPVIEKAIRLTYERSHLLKNAILAVTTSAAFSGILVLVTILEHGSLEIHDAPDRCRLHCRLYHFLCAGSPNFSEDHPHLHSRRERLIVVQFR